MADWKNALVDSMSFQYLGLTIIPPSYVPSALVMQRKVGSYLSFVVVSLLLLSFVFNKSDDN